MVIDQNSRQFTSQPANELHISTVLRLIWNYTTTCVYGL